MRAEEHQGCTAMLDYTNVQDAREGECLNASAVLSKRDDDLGTGNNEPTEPRLCSLRLTTSLNAWDSSTNAA